jgi:cyclophilin family peptidyl-prolyl cis-trans isomerase
MRIMQILLVAGLAGSLTACGGDQESADQTDTSADRAPAAVEETSTDPQADDPSHAEEAAQVEETKSENPIVARSLARDPGPADETAVMKTNYGDITLRFFPQQAPLAVSNFKGLAAKGFYDGITFHRVIPNFMLQGGDPTGSGRGGTSLWGSTFADEFDPALTFTRPGILAMANRGPATNSSQFFITQVPTPHLNNKHTIFGEVVEGMEVVNAIAVVEKGPGDKPIKPVVIESITISGSQ